ncbi:MAG: NTP transferase domain-containing protein [Acidimicrobiia bacterium]
MSTPMVLLAAGMGSRFGGPKQLVPVRPDGASLLGIAAEEAVGAGFDHLVIVTRSELVDQVNAMLDLTAPSIQRTIVLQDKYGTPRDKPWGTAHAIAACADALHEPFGIANADDHYGAESFVALKALLSEEHGGIVAFPIRATLSANGAVTRGLVQTENHVLVDIDERGGLHVDGSRILDGAGAVISDDAVVSMNLWALPSRVAAELVGIVEGFVDSHGDDPGAECLLPTEIGQMVEDDQLEVRVVDTTSSWAGLTHPDDLEPLRKRFAAL